MSSVVSVRQGRAYHRRSSIDAATQEAAVVVRPLSVAVCTVRVLDPAHDQVRVRLQGCGISTSQLPVWSGGSGVKYPQAAGAPGHEGWGIVDAIGAGVTDLEVGQRVALLSDHAFAEYDIAPRQCVVPLPEELDDEPFPGEAFAHAMNIYERCGFHAGQSVAVIGADFIGLLLTQLAADRGAHVVAISDRPSDLESAIEMDAEETLLMTDFATVDTALRINAGRGFDRVILVSSTRAARDLAKAICGEHGRLIVTQKCSPREHFISGVEKAIQTVLEGRLDPFPLLTHEVSLRSLSEGLQLTRDRPRGFSKALMMVGR